MAAEVYDFSQPLRPASKEEALQNHRYQVVMELRRRLSSDRDVKGVPGLVGELLEVEAWKERRTQLGRLLPPTDSTTWCTTSRRRASGPTTTPSSA